MCDFGLVVQLDPEQSTFQSDNKVGTLWYRAPESLLGGNQVKLGRAFDIWAIGCIFAEMVRGSALFVGDSEIGQIMEIFNVLGTPNDERWKGVNDLVDFKDKIFPQFDGVGLQSKCPDLCKLGLDLMERMLTYDPSKRITAQDALHHPFLSEPFVDTST